MISNCTVVAAIAGLLLTASASADTIIDTYPDWEGRITYDWTAVAQSFTVPADNILKTWTFAIAPANGQNTVRVEVFAWSTASGPIGSALYSNVVAWPAGGGDVNLNSINLPLSTGGVFALIVDLQGYRGYSVHFQENQNSYTGGNASWYSPEFGWNHLAPKYNTTFRASFVPAPGVLGVLTMSGLAALRRRR